MPTWFVALFSQMVSWVVGVGHVSAYPASTSPPQVSYASASPSSEPLKIAVVSTTSPQSTSAPTAWPSSVAVSQWPATSSAVQTEPSINPEPSASQDPSPSASARLGESPPPSSSDVLGSFAQLYASTSPLRTPLANLSHAVIQSPLSQAVWDEEQFSGSAPVAMFIPLYYSSNPNDELVTVARCSMFGGNCPMAGRQVHVNPSDMVQTTVYDHHFMVIDPALNEEIDGWECARNGDGTVDLSGGTLKCAWGGYFPLGSSGVMQPWGTGIAGGFPYGLVATTPQELLAGAGGIAHALALNAVCMNDSAHYPSNYPGPTGAPCHASGAPHYGDVLQYVGQTPDQIAADKALSNPCAAIRYALAVYGGYFSDNGSSPTMIDGVAEVSYTSDPGEMSSNAYPLVVASLNAAGEARGASYQNCLNGLSASQFNLVGLTPQ